MRRLLVAAAVALASLAAAAPASATTIDVTITCDEVTYSYSRFPEGLTSSSFETVTVNGLTVHSSTFAFTGPAAVSVVPLDITGSATVVASYAWQSPYNQGTGSEQASVSCGGGTTTGGDTTGGDTTGGDTTTGGTTGTGGVIGGTTGGTEEPGGELPFTGLPIWVPLLLAGALLAGGVFLLRRRRDELS